MGALTDADHQLTKRRPGGTCSVRIVLESVDNDDQATVLGWLRDRNGVSANAIANELQGHGHDIGTSAVERHRRGDCKCPIEAPEFAV